MYELIKVTENCYYVDCPAKIGIVKTAPGEVVLIDSGNNKDAGKKVLRHLNENGWRATAILNTHSHADHIGGNAFLQKETGCKIYARGIECDFTNHPILEPAFLYGGYPYSDLRHKFLLAEESRAEYLTEDLLPSGMTLLPLPGHSFDMVGFRTADGVVYLADALSSKETLDKYAVSFIYDVGAYLETLRTLNTMDAALFVPSHAAPTEDIAPLARYNIEKVFEIAERILRICEFPMSFEAILMKLCEYYSITMTHEQYVLVGSTLRSYLSWLKGDGRLIAAFIGNLPCYQTR